MELNAIMIERVFGEKEIKSSAPRKKCDDDDDKNRATHTGTHHNDRCIRFALADRAKMIVTRAVVVRMHTILRKSEDSNGILHVK